MKKSKLEEVGLTFPSGIWLIFFFMIPTTIIFLYAFKSADIYGGINDGWTMKNIYQLFTPFNLKILARTVYFAAITTIICLSLALPTGFFLSQTHAKTRKLLLLLIVVPFWTSFLIRVFAWKSLLHPEGALKKILVTLHIVQPDTLLLYNASAVLLVMLYTYLPFAILPIYTAAEKFNFSLFEAAMDLGATRSKAFFKIFLPYMKPAIMTAFLMVFIPAVGAYIIPEVVGGVNNEVLGNRIAQRTFVDRDLPEASALSLALAFAVLLPMICIYWLQSEPSKSSLKKEN